MEISPLIVWNAVITLIVAPLYYTLRKNEKDIESLEEVVADFRVETAKMYVSKKDLAEDVDRTLIQLASIIDSINRLDAKVDSLLLDR